MNLKPKGIHLNSKLKETSNMNIVVRAHVCMFLLKTY